MGELESIFTKLNIMDQLKLNKYINREINKIVLGNQQKIDEEVAAAQAELDRRRNEMNEFYVKANDETWQRIETLLHIAMREAHISPERINKIDNRVNELSEEREGQFLMGEERKSKYKVLEDADFQKIMELITYKYCNSCSSRNSKCEVYPLLKKYGIPQTNEGFKCKYAYVRKLKMSCERSE